MVTDQQARRLFVEYENGKSQEHAADKAGMSTRTAGKYLRAGLLPSQTRAEHTWKTRRDPFEEHWPRIEELLFVNPGLEAKTVLEDLQQKHPDEISAKHLRTLQRRFHDWRALNGPAREVFFPQVHYPGRLCASDFTHMDSLGVTIRKEPFKHLIYHFVLTYSNWETFSICYSESFESLCEGFQNAVWELGGTVPRHRSDRLSAAVNKDCNPEKFTARYNAMLRHYDVAPERTNAYSGNENGDVETSHRHFKNVVNQELMLRGSKDFASLGEYEQFLRNIIKRRNATRHERFAEEKALLRSLPIRRFESYATLFSSVSKSSTITVQNNIYSVHSRLIGERVQVRLHIERIEVWYGQTRVELLPRLRGRGQHRIEYRHIIDWLVRKPGAMNDYRYKADLFPSSHFRMVWDWLREHMPLQANREYVKILHCAAYESQTATENAIRHLIEAEQALTATNIKIQVEQRLSIPRVSDVVIVEPDLAAYDTLLEKAVCCE